MGKRSILFYWLLILVPAVIISVAAFRLLSHEQERINKLAFAAIQDRTRAIGETLQVTVEAVEDEITESLLKIQPEELKETLLQWERGNPLVRNVFIWNEKEGLLYPATGIASTTEERRFISRFEGLFSGRIPWHDQNRGTETEEPHPLTSATSTDTVQDLSETKPVDLAQDISKFKEGRQELLKIAKGYDFNNEEKSAAIREAHSTTRGWIPWFSENKLYVLGWVKAKDDGPVYGIELELMTLLSRLIGNFPPISSEQSGYALVDDEGRLLHQVGSVGISTEDTPLLIVSLAPHLPHWSLAVYVFDQTGLTQSGNEFVILAGLLLAIFFVSIIAGGSLLMRQAHRNMTDARQKTSFVSNVSHELKTPLTSIRMFAELLMEERVKDPEKRKNYLQVIVSESRRLTRLVNNVLDFSRLEQGQKKYHFEEIDLSLLLREILELHEPRIKKSGMEVILSLPTEIISVKTDRDALEQVMLNLIDNAIKYAGEGRELSVSISTDDLDLEIRIEDRGPGVPEGHRKKIFDKFHRVDDTLTAKQQGSGLGLSIARRMLRDIGGDLYYHPRQGGGSSFIATIPLNPNRSI